MGKYTRKPKTSGDVSAIDVLPSSSLGVRTRAKTLALQRLQSSSSSSLKPDYLELRSRRLEKPPLLLQYLQNSRKTPAQKQVFACGGQEKPRIESALGSGLTIGEGKAGGACVERQGGGFEIGDLEIEVSLGENVLDMEARGTRESTPCSLIRTVDTITTPGSSTKQRSPAVSSQRVQNVLRTIPTARELEEFFTHAEQPHKNYFIEKYNFDIANDLPLPGRYEWMRVTP